MPILLTEDRVIRGHATYLKSLVDEMIYQLARQHDNESIRDAALKIELVAVKLNESVKAHFTDKVIYKRGYFDGR